MVIDEIRPVYFGTTRVNVVASQTISFCTFFDPYVFQFESIRLVAQPQTKAEKNQARLKHLRGRAGRWA
jgi:hypothetical protein